MRKTVLALALGLLLGSAGTSVAATSETIQATVAKLRFVVNGEERELRTDPLVVDGTSYLPVREVANLLGYDVTYRADSRTVEFLGPTNNAQKGASSVTEWISLRDLGEQYNLMIRQTTEDGKVYGIFRGDDIVLTILYDNKALSASASTPTGESVGATVENSRVLLNLNDLKAAGIIQ